MKVRAQDHRIDVAAEHFEHVKINCRIHVQIGAIAALGVFPVRAVQRGVEFGKEGFQIVALGDPLR